MSKFEDHLWSEFVREHGDALTQLRRPPATHTRRARPRLVVGTGFGLAGVGGVLALILGATATSPAFAVTRNHDGTVTISVARSSGVAGANAKLHELGIRARVMAQVPIGCQLTLDSHVGGQGARAAAQTIHAIANSRWTIDPRQVPVGQTLALTPPPTRPGGNSGNSGNSGSAANSGSGTGGGSRGQVWSCGMEGAGNGHSGPPPNPESGNSGNSGTSGNS